MKEFKYFCIHFVGNEYKRLNDGILTEETILWSIAKYPSWRKMSVEQGFYALLQKWNSEQLGLQTYFYGPL